MTQKVRAGKHSQGFRTELQGRRAWGDGRRRRDAGVGEGQHEAMLSPGPPRDPSRLTPRTPFGTASGPRSGMISTDRYSGRIRGGARSRRENGRGVRGRRDKILRVRGGREGTADPTPESGEKGNQRMIPRARRRAVSKRHLPPGRGAERSRAGSGRDPPGTSSDTHSRRPVGASAPRLTSSSASLCPRWSFQSRPASSLETRAAVRTRGFLLKKITYF